MYRFSPLLASQGRDIAYAPRTVGHGWKTVLLIADLQADPGQQGFTVQAPKPIQTSHLKKHQSNGGSLLANVFLKYPEGW